MKMCHYMILLENSVSRRASQWTAEVNLFLGSDAVAKSSSTDFRGLMEELRNSKKSGLDISIDLKIATGKPFLDVVILDPFLREFGHAVRMFDCYTIGHVLRNDGFHFRTYCTFLASFPNLEALKCTKYSNGGGCDSQEAEVTQLLHLKRITVGEGVAFRHWNHILEMAPNVEEILEFPINSVEMLQCSGKTGALKSVYFPFFDTLKSRRPNLEQFRTSFKQLADLGVQLTSLSVPDFYWFAFSYGWKLDADIVYDMRRQYFRILQSSEGSLTSLDVPAANYLRNFLSLSLRLVRVKRVKLDGLFVPSFACFFPEGFHLKQILPNLESLEINMEHRSNDLNICLPWDIFGPDELENSIKFLKTNTAAVDCIAYLARLFPSVTHLSIELGAKETEEVLPAIANGWSHLEALTIIVPFSECYVPRRVPGIQSSRESHKKHTKPFGDEVAVLFMRNLRRLEFVLEEARLNCDSCDGSHIPPILLAMANVLKDEPHVKMVVRVPGLSSMDALGEQLHPIAKYIRLNPSDSSGSNPFWDDV